MILIEKIGVKECESFQFTCTTNSGIGWNQHPRFLLESEFSSLPNIERAMIVLANRSQAPTTEVGLNPVDDAILRVLDAERDYDKVLTKYRMRIVIVSRDDRKAIKAFLEKHKKLHLKVWKGSTLKGALIGAVIGSVLQFIMIEDPFLMCISALVGALAGSVIGSLVTQNQGYSFNALKMIDVKIDNIKKITDEAARSLLQKLRQQVQSTNINQDDLSELSQLAALRHTFFKEPFQIDNHNVDEFLRTYDKEDQKVEDKSGASAKNDNNSLDISDNEKKHYENERFQLIDNQPIETLAGVAKENYLDHIPNFFKQIFPKSEMEMHQEASARRCLELTESIRQTKKCIKKLDNFIVERPRLAIQCQEKIQKHPEHVAYINRSELSVESVDRETQLGLELVYQQHELSERMRFLKSHLDIWKIFEREVEQTRDGGQLFLQHLI